jgi:O-antigen/teichoic acid export membrane protein
MKSHPQDPCLEARWSPGMALATALDETNARARAEAARATRAAGLLTAAGLFTGLVNLAFNALVARLGGASAYGAISVLLSVGTVAGFLGIGTSYAVAHWASLSQRPLGALLPGALRSATPWMVVGGVLAVVSGPASDFLHLDGAGLFLMADVLFVVTILVAVPGGLLIGARRFAIIAGLSVFAAVLRLALGATLTRGSPVAGSMLASLVPPAAIGLMSTAIVLRSTGIDRQSPEPMSPEPESPQSEHRGYVARQGVIGALLAAGLWGLWSMPLVLARHALSGGASGDFAAAQVLTSSILFLVTPCITAFYPSVVRHPDRRVILTGLWVISSIALGAAVGVVVVGPPLMARVYGSHFAASTGIFVPLGASAVCISIASYLSWVARAIGRHLTVLAMSVGVGLIVEFVIGSSMRGDVALAAQPALAVGIAGLLAAVSMVVAKRSPWSRWVAAVSSSSSG